MTIGGIRGRWEGYGGKRKDRRGIGAKKYLGILESGEK